jgi:predicted nuclease of predicted toxin-antitoxin system
MRFLVDAQLPPQLAAWLRDRGHEASALREIGLRDADDADIWSRALADGAIIVTKDEDFAAMAGRIANGPQVLWVRSGNLLRRALIDRFEAAWPQVEPFLAGGASVVELR